MGHFIMMGVVAIRFITFIIGVATVPDFAFDALIYNLSKLIVWGFVLTMIAIAPGFIFKSIKFDASKIPTRE